MEELLTTEQVADYLKVCTKTVQYMAKRQGLPHIRLGTRTFRFKKTDVEEYIQNMIKQQTEPNNSEGATSDK